MNCRPLISPTLSDLDPACKVDLTAEKVFKIPSCKNADAFKGLSALADYYALMSFFLAKDGGVNIENAVLSVVSGTGAK